MLSLSNIKSQTIIAFALSTIPLALAPGVCAQKNYEVLYRFGAHVKKDGAFPVAGPVFDQTGNLYGTTSSGGDCDEGGGTVFELTPTSDGQWMEKLLHQFCASNNDGETPLGGVIFDGDGNLYGTTEIGGKDGGGIVFELMPGPDGTWSEKMLYEFAGADGSRPTGSLIFDQEGNLYGTTIAGGKKGEGTVFKLTPNSNGTWNESVLYSFCSLKNCSDGWYPTGGLVLDAGGNLYGTTTWGGNYSGECFQNGCGTVFMLTPGQDAVILLRFNDNNGAFPLAGVVFDADGNMYGTTGNGGAANAGVVFELSTNGGGKWVRKTLYEFKSGTDGDYPDSPPLLDSAGNLYGTTSQGGALAYCRNVGFGGCGLVFKLVPSTNGEWKKTVLHFFYDKPSALPNGALVFDAADDIYGVTYGDLNTGTVYEITSQ